MKQKTLSLILLAVLLLTLLASCKSPEPSDGPRRLTSAMDLTAEWDKVADAGSLVQGCIVVRRAFLDAHPDAVEAFLSSYKASVNYLLNDPAGASTMIADAGIFANAAVAAKAIPNCNICYLDGKEMKNAMEVYLAALCTIAPASVGGKLPDNEFYYTSPAEKPVAGDAVDVRVYSLNGTTGFGMAKMMSDVKNGLITDENYTFSVRADASDVSAALISGDADIAALPTNAAANLYQKTSGKIVLLAVNTRGCLYLLTDGKAEKITSFADLKGKTVCVPAQNPTFIFTYLCEKNGLKVGSDVMIDSTSYAAAATLREALVAGKVHLAVLPEPMVTVAMNAVNTQDTEG